MQVDEKRLDGFALNLEVRENSGSESPVVHLTTRSLSCQHGHDKDLTLRLFLLF